MALTDSLISYWKLDEASGNALDAHGSNTLTANGTGGVASTTGKIGNCRDLEYSDGDYFTIADNTDVSTGDIDFTISGWFNQEAVSSGSGADFRSMMGKWNSGNNEYLLYYDGVASRYTWIVSAAGGTNSAVWSSGPSSSTWYFVVVWHDSVNNLIGISVNNGTAVTTSHAHGVRDGSAPFELGRHDGNATPVYWDGLIDEVGFWKRVLTSGERTSLYNGGSGLAYPFTTTSGVRLLSKPCLFRPKFAGALVQ